VTFPLLELSNPPSTLPPTLSTPTLAQQLGIDPSIRLLAQSLDNLASALVYVARVVQEATSKPLGSGPSKPKKSLRKRIEEAEKLNPEFAALLIVLCYTGMRLGEALGLTWENTRLQDGYAYLPDTKNAEPRAVFLPPVAVARLANLDAGGSRVFRFAKGGHLYSILKVAAFRAGVDLPERSAFHIFRRTYATWMMRYAGLNSRQLVGTGAWKDFKMANRYAQTIVSEESMKAALLPTPKRRMG
jgi:integrase